MIRTFVDKIGCHLLDNYQKWELENPFKVWCYEPLLREDGLKEWKLAIELSWTFHPRLDMSISKPGIVKLNWHEKKVIWNAILTARALKVNAVKFNQKPYDPNQDV